MPKARRVYYDLTIVASSPDTDIWLGDDDGHLVRKEIGELETSLLAGDYIVEFGLGSTPYPIHLTRSTRYKQEELAAGPTCLRSTPRFLGK